MARPLPLLVEPASTTQRSHLFAGEAKLQQTHHARHTRSVLAAADACHKGGGQ